MDRHRPHAGLALLALVLVAACTGAAFRTSAAAAQAPKRPNIVFVLSDDQRWDTLGSMPNVQKELVAHGVTFTNSFVPTSLCCPSRASILTGKYAHSTGVYLNIGAHGGFRAFHDSNTIATVLHKAGYTTGLFGKYLNRYGVAAKDAHYVPPGWDDWHVFLSKTKYYDYQLDENRHVRSYGHDAHDYSTDVLAQKAVSFVQHAKGPFFMELTPFGPHEPATPPLRYARAFASSTWSKPPSFNAADVMTKPAYIRRLPDLDAKRLVQADQFRRNQLASALAVDDAVGELVKALKAKHQLENTMIVYASDNGVSWGEHHLVAARKLVPYEESIRVPLVVRYDPLTHGRPRQDRRLALNIDYAPTFAALAGSRMKGAEGRNLLPVVAGMQPAWRHNFLIEHLHGPPQTDVPTYCGVRTERYKYVLYQTREEELYDLKLDPFELKNEAADPALAAVKDRLRTRLATLCTPRPPGYTVLGSPHQPA
jgi:N-acetylglucosamine-6-sulfatase